MSAICNASTSSKMIKSSQSSKTRAARKAKKTVVASTGNGMGAAPSFSEETKAEQLLREHGQRMEQEFEYERMRLINEHEQHEQQVQQDLKHRLLQAPQPLWMKQRFEFGLISSNWASLDEKKLHMDHVGCEKLRGFEHSKRHLISLCGVATHSIEKIPNLGRCFARIVGKAGCNFAKFTEDDEDVILYAHGGNWFVMIKGESEIDLKDFMKQFNEFANDSISDWVMRKFITQGPIQDQVNAYWRTKTAAYEKLWSVRDNSQQPQPQQQQSLLVQ